MILVASLLIKLIFSAEIKSLPNLDFQIYTKQYSGYLNVSDTHRIHYWFIESQNTPSVDPLIFWFNGGPGCSSLFGLVEEIGPFVFFDNNNTFRRNEYTWNRIANIVYVESPAGVGFSYTTDGNITTNDDGTADQNYGVVKEFLKEFYQYRNHDVFLAGESYAGVYIPMLTDRIIDGQKDFPIRLKGISIGNGLMVNSTASPSWVFNAYYHGLLAKNDYESEIETTHLNNYIRVFGFTGRNLYDISQKCVRCRYNQEKINTYFENSNVTEALHIPETIGNWKMCDRGKYSKNFYEMSEFVRKAVKNDVRTLLYYGDQDLRCDFLMGQQFAANLSLPKISSKSPWYSRGKHAGYKTVYNGLTFLTVRGAGHMVPMTHPQESFTFIQQFLKNQPI